MPSHLLKVTQLAARRRTRKPSPAAPPPAPWPQLFLWFASAERRAVGTLAFPREQDSRSRDSACLLHPLFLEAHEALVHHVHGQVLVGQSSLHLIQNGGANWERGREGQHQESLSAAPQYPPAHSGMRQPAQRHSPRSAATGLPLVTTNSYLLRGCSPSHPTAWRLERVAVWTSTTTANSGATQTHCSVKCAPSPHDKPARLCGSESSQTILGNTLVTRG